MSVMIEQDLREILTKIDQRLERIENDVTDLKIGQTRLEGELKRVESDLKGQINQVDSDLKGQIKQVESDLKGELKLVEEKVNGLEKRFGFQEWINRGILICLIGAVLGGFLKIFGLIPNP